MRDLLEAAGMADAVSVASAGSRDYNVGDGPDPLLVAVAEELQLRCVGFMLAKLAHCNATVTETDATLDRVKAASA